MLLFFSGVKTSDIKGNDGMFHLVWEPRKTFTCGYVLDWYPTYEAQKCDIKWIKIPSNVTSANISSGQ